MSTVPFSQEAINQMNGIILEMPVKFGMPLIQIINGELQKAHDAAVDRRDMPSGATIQPDQFVGD